MYVHPTYIKEEMVIADPKSCDGEFIQFFFCVFVQHNT